MFKCDLKGGLTLSYIFNHVIDHILQHHHHLNLPAPAKKLFYEQLDKAYGTLPVHDMKIFLETLPLK